MRGTWASARDSEVAGVVHPMLRDRDGRTATRTTSTDAAVNQEAHCVYTFSTRCAVVSAMRRAVQLGQIPRRLQLNATTTSS